MANTGSFIAWGLLFSLGAGVPAASGDLIHGARMAGSAFRELAYPGAEVLRDFQSVVNQVPVSTALFSTRAPVTAVRAYYSARLAGAGWIREAGAEKAERNEVLVDAGGGYMVATRDDRTLRVHLLPAGKAGGTFIYLQLKAKQTDQRGSLPAEAVARRIHPIPLFPGVPAAFYLEDGQDSGRALAMYSTMADPAAVSAFYEKKLLQVGWRLEFSYPTVETGKREGRVMVYESGESQCLLSVQKEGRNPTTVLLIMGRELKVSRSTGGENGCQTGAIS